MPGMSGLSRTKNKTTIDNDDQLLALSLSLITDADPTSASDHYFEYLNQFAESALPRIPRAIRVLRAFSSGFISAWRIRVRRTLTPRLEIFFFLFLFFAIFHGVRPGVAPSSLR